MKTKNKQLGVFTVKFVIGFIIFIMLIGLTVVWLMLKDKQESVKVYSTTTLSLNADIETLISKYYDAEADCRGSYDEQLSKKGCQDREDISKIIESKRWCYKVGKFSALSRWANCNDLDKVVEEVTNEEPKQEVQVDVSSTSKPMFRSGIVSTEYFDSEECGETRTIYGTPYGLRYKTVKVKYENVNLSNGLVNFDTVPCKGKYNLHVSKGKLGKNLRGCLAAKEQCYFITWGLDKVAFLVLSRIWTKFSDSEKADAKEITKQIAESKSNHQNYSLILSDGLTSNGLLEISREGIFFPGQVPD